MKASQLKQLISKFVAEELERQLPKVLSEMYVKRLVSESATVTRAPLQASRPVSKSTKQVAKTDPTQNRKKLLEQILGDEDNSFPEAPANSFEGRQARNFMASSSPFASIIQETMEEIESDNSHQLIDPSIEGAAPDLDVIEEHFGGLDFSAMAATAKKLDKKIEQKKQISSADQEREEARLKMVREKLDRMVG